MAKYTVLLTPDVEAISWSLTIGACAIGARMQPKNGSEKYIRRYLDDFPNFPKVVLWHPIIKIRMTGYGT